MKRFITEYANYKIDEIWKDKAIEQSVKNDRIRRIDLTKYLAERGAIKIDEAMKQIAEA